MRLPFYTNATAETERGEPEHNMSVTRCGLAMVSLSSKRG